MVARTDLVVRLNKLGIACDDVPLDRVDSATSALACLPMYAVANSHGWTSDTQFKLPFFDIEGVEGLREAWAIGKEESLMEVSREHRRVLGQFLRHPRAADAIIYDYAFETLALFLDLASPQVAEVVRVRVARSCVHVARAAGKGLFGTGEKVSEGERAVIDVLRDILGLNDCEPAAIILEELEVR